MLCADVVHRTLDLINWLRCFKDNRTCWAQWMCKACKSTDICTFSVMRWFPYDVRILHKSISKILSSRLKTDQTEETEGVEGLSISNRSWIFYRYMYTKKQKQGKKELKKKKKLKRIIASSFLYEIEVISAPCFQTLWTSCLQGLLNLDNCHSNTANSTRFARRKSSVGRALRLKIPCSNPMNNSGSKRISIFFFLGKTGFY